MAIADDSSYLLRPPLRSVPSNTTYSEIASDDVEIRCPNNPSRLFAILIENGSTPKITSNNVFEIACPDCARIRRRAGTPVYRILHRYDFSGELVETIEVLKEQQP